MKRFFRISWLLLIPLALPLLSLHAQPLNGVYAGVELRLSVLIGGGMDRVDNVIFFRPDGTFTDKLDKPTWKTDVTGRYQVSGKKVSLLYKDGSKDDVNMLANGDLDAGSYNLFRLKESDSVPPGFYKFTYASGAGGGSSNLTYVGTSGQTGLNFDGKGHFTRNSASATLIAGDNIGGGSNRKDSGGGTYTLKDGVLVLTFADGTSKTHSFFCSPQQKPVMAAFDGDIYFMVDPEEEAAKEARRTAKKTVVEPSPAAATDAVSLLKKANLAHGGKALDDLKTVKAAGQVAGIGATTLLDVSARKLRVELRVNNQLTLVEQLEGDAGWQWRNGRKTPLPPGRVNEMSRVFTTGILGLRSANLATLPAPRIAATKNGMTSVTYQAGGTTFVLILNTDNQLVGEGTTINQLTTTVLYADLKPVQGVVLPFTERQVTGAQKLSIQYTDYQLNPRFDTAVWNIPN